MTDRNPEDHLRRTEHLTEAPSDAAIDRTFLGMAHIAGTGPAGATCRECIFWHGWRLVTNQETGETQRRSAHSWFPSTHPETPLALKRQRCHRPILNKARKGVPYHASACRLFRRNPFPPTVLRPERKKPQTS